MSVEEQEGRPVVQGKGEGGVFNDESAPSSLAAKCIMLVGSGFFSSETSKHIFEYLIDRI